jgi:hypothetical protein
MVALKSDKETWLNYIIQPLARDFLDDVPSVQLLATRDWHDFISLKPL